MKKVCVGLVPAMFSLILTSCPGEDCEGEHTPNGYVVKMNTDYSEYVMTTMSISLDTVYSNYCFPSSRTFHLDGNYYFLSITVPPSVAYISIKYSDWNDSTKNACVPISDYVLAPAPFDEVYEIYGDFSISEIKDFVKERDFSKFKKNK